MSRSHSSKRVQGWPSFEHVPLTTCPDGWWFMIFIGSLVPGGCMLAAVAQEQERPAVKMERRVSCRPAADAQAQDPMGGRKNFCRNWWLLVHRTKSTKFWQLKIGQHVIYHPKWQFVNTHRHERLQEISNMLMCSKNPEIWCRRIL